MRLFLDKTDEKFTTKSTKDTKGDEKVYQDFFVLFVSFLVRLISRVAAESCAVMSENR
jgi:hypothetical protein